MLAHPANAQRLRDEGIEGKNELFPPYLVPGAKAYVARSRPTVAAGDRGHPRRRRRRGLGAPVLGRRRAARRRSATLDEFAAAGLDGVECFYVTHTEEQTRLLHDYAMRRGLLTTGSTDFHGPEHDRFSAFRGFEVHGLTVELGPIGGNTGYERTS